MALAGWQTPTLLHVPDIEPALALKTIARFADRITLTDAASKGSFPVARTHPADGIPAAFRPRGLVPSKRTVALWPLPDLPTLLVTGGSKGARSINNAILAHLPALLEKTQIIHISGPLDWPTVEAAARSLPPEKLARYQARPYLHEIGAALAAANLVVSRAGASTLASTRSLGFRPSWSHTRTPGATKRSMPVLAEHSAAIILEDQLLEQELPALIHSLLDNPAKLQAMRLPCNPYPHPMQQKPLKS